MRVEVYSDASWRQQRRIGSWATLVVAGGVVGALDSGRCLAEVGSSNDAELEGVYRGLERAVRAHGHVVTRLVVYCDNTHALRCLARRHERRPGLQGAMQQALCELLAAVAHVPVEGVWMPDAAKRTRAERVHPARIKACHVAAGRWVSGRRPVEAAPRRQRAVVRRAPVAARVLGSAGPIASAPPVEAHAVDARRPIDVDAYVYGCWNEGLRAGAWAVVLALDGVRQKTTVGVCDRAATELGCELEAMFRGVRRALHGRKTKLGRLRLHSNFGRALDAVESRANPRQGEEGALQAAIDGLLRLRGAPLPLALEWTPWSGGSGVAPAHRKRMLAAFRAARRRARRLARERGRRERQLRTGAAFGADSPAAAPAA